MGARRRAFGLTAALVLLAVSGSAAAHAAGAAVEARIEFPPAILWGAGALVVALSFAVVGGFLSRREEPRPAEPGGPSAPPATLQVPALLAFLATGVFGVLGGEAAPFLLWTVLSGLIPLLSYLLANAWEPLHPFRPLLALARRLRAPSPYPARLGEWPAVATLLALAAAEASRAPEVTAPVVVGAFLLAYAALTFLGMVAWGEAWLAHGEVFGVAARWWSAFAPILTRRGWLRAPPPVAGWSGVAFLVALLYAVNLDGFLATRTGIRAVNLLLPALGIAGSVLAVALAGYALFLVAFLLAVAALRRAAESLSPLRTLAAALAPALLPIAAAYHLAHAGPALAGTFTAVPDAALPWIGAFQIVAILAGHVLAVAVAHRLAFGAFPSRIMAIRGEVPLTAVMILYTVVGLGILGSAGGA